MDHAPDAERLRALHETNPKLQFRNPNPWIAEALVKGDVEQLAGTKDGVDIIAAHSPERAQMMREGLAGGMDGQDITTYSSIGRVRAIVAMREVDYRSDSKTLNGAIVNGHDPASLKKYGIGLASNHRRADLDASEVKPAVLKAMASGWGRGSVADYEKLAAGKLRTFKDITTLKESLHRPTVHTMSNFGRHAPPSVYASFTNNGRDKLTENQAHNVAYLHSVGLSSPSAVDERLGSNFYREAERHQVVMNALSDRADVIEAGIPTRDIERMSRAGIPLSAMKHHKAAADVWSAGAPYRKAYEENELGGIKLGWSSQQRTWSFTRYDYDAF